MTQTAKADDTAALIDEISDKLQPRKTVTTQSRAAAIWELWELIVEESDEVELEKHKYPPVTEIANICGVPVSTASRWMEPLREEFETAKREAEKTEGYVLNQIQIGSATSEALAEAARNEKTTREDVVKEAIQTHLRLDGCLNEVSE